MYRRRMKRWLAPVFFAVLFVLAATVRWWGRAVFPVKYERLVLYHASRHGLDPLLVMALIREESAFAPRAVSRRGARGLMQIMPETGAWIAAQTGLAYEPNQLLSPDPNIRLGTWYLAYLLRDFGGDPIKALAAYNAGHNRIRDWLDKGIWDGRLATLDRVPYPETRRYVMKIVRSYRIYRFLYRTHENT